MRLGLPVLQTLLQRIEKTAQDVDVFGLRVGAAEQALHTAHQTLAVAAVEKADVVHHAFHVGDHTFDLLVGGGVVFLLQVGHGRIGLAEDFVAHDLHGLGKVEREIVGIAVDGHQSVAGPDFFNAQAEGFVAEHECGLFATLRHLQQLGNECARGLQRGGDFAAAAGEGAGDGGIGEGFVQRGDDFGVVQYVRRAGSEDEAFFRQCKTLHVIGIENRRVFRHRRSHQIGGDDGQFVQTHRFHRARGGTDIGGMAGAREDNADVAEIVGQGGFESSHVRFSVGME